MQWYEVCEELLRTGGSIAKKNIILKNLENKRFLDVMKFAFDRHTITGINRKKLEKRVIGVENNLGINIRTIENGNESCVIDYLSRNFTGRDLDVSYLMSIIDNSSSELEKSWLKNIVIKDFPIGISAKTLNELIPGFIKVFAVQLAVSYNFKDPSKNKIKGRSFTLTKKIDGNRCVVFNGFRKTEAFSRSGKKIEGIEYLLNYIRDNYPLGYVYDVEIEAVRTEDMTTKDVFDKTQSIMRTKGVEKLGLQVIAFDMIPIEAFEKGYYAVTYEVRKSILDGLGESEYFKIVETYYVGSDVLEIDKQLTVALENDCEGLMLNINSSPYICERHSGLMKIKKFYNIDLRVKGVQEHRRGGKAGALIVDFKGFDLAVAGLKNDEMVEFWKNPSSIIGKIIELRFFEESKNQEGGESLRFASFVRIRDDKTEVNYEIY